MVKDSRDEHFKYALKRIAVNHKGQETLSFLYEYLDLSVMSVDAIVATVEVANKIGVGNIPYWKTYFDKCLSEIENRGMDTSHLYRLLEKTND